MIDQFFEYFGITGGVMLILGAGLIIFLLVAIVLEGRTRILFPDRKKSREDFDLFDFNDEDK